LNSTHTHFGLRTRVHALNSSHPIFLEGLFIIVLTHRDMNKRPWYEFSIEEIFNPLLEKGLEEVKLQNLVKGCGYLIVNSGTLATMGLYHGIFDYTDPKTQQPYVTHLQHYKGIDEEGDPIFSDSEYFPPEKILPIYGNPKWYTYTPYDCDASVLKERNAAKAHFEKGFSTGGRRRKRQTHRRRSHRKRTRRQYR